MRSPAGGSGAVPPSRSLAWWDVWVDQLERTGHWIANVVARWVVFFSWVSILFVAALSLAMFVYAAVLSIAVPDAQLATPLYFDMRDPLPAAQLVLMRPGQKFNESLPATAVRVPTEAFEFSASHGYSLTLLADLPYSEPNIALGMQMATLTLYADSGKVLMRSARPFMLPFRAGLIHTARRLLYAVPLSLELMDDIHSLRLPLLNHPAAPWWPAIGQIVIELSSAGFQLHKASLLVQTELDGFSYLAVRYAGTSAVFAVVVLTSLTFSLLWLCCWSRIRRSISAIRRRDKRSTTVVPVEDRLAARVLTMLSGDHSASLPLDVLRTAPELSTTTVASLAPLRDTSVDAPPLPGSPASAGEPLPESVASAASPLAGAEDNAEAPEPVAASGDALVSDHGDSGTDDDVPASSAATNATRGAVGARSPSPAAAAAAMSAAVGDAMSEWTQHTVRRRRHRRH